MEQRELTVLKNLDPVDFFLFVMLWLSSDEKGIVRKTQKEIRQLVHGARMSMESGHRIVLSVKGLYKHLRRLTYVGILEPANGSQPDSRTREQKHATPLRLRVPWLQDLRQDILDQVSQAEYDRLKKELDRVDARRKEEWKRNKKLSEELRAMREGFSPQFITENPGEDQSARDYAFRRLWAWFTLLEIEEAFVKVKEKAPEEFEPDLDYSLMGMWLSRFGLELMEEHLLKFYMNRRLNELKQDAGGKWPDAVVRFLFATFRNVKKERKTETRSREEEDYGRFSRLRSGKTG